MDDQQHMPPTTTAEQDLRTAGQRNINRIWEVTQAMIAICVVTAVLYYCVFVEKTTVEKLLFLTNSFSIVIGFYFGRTNHQRTGGIGGDTAGSR